MKKKGILVALVLLVIFAISRIDFRSPEDYYNQDQEVENVLVDESSSEKTTLNGSLQNEEKNKLEKEVEKDRIEQVKKNKANKSDTIKVTIFIDVKNLQKEKNYAILKPELRKYVPDSGIVMSRQTIEVKEGSTAFDVLQKAVRLNKIQMEYQGANENIYNSVYVQGINHIYEFSAGSESGWMYSVNGVFPNFGMSRKTMANNDVIRMVYTCDLGCDVGYSMKQCN